MSQHYESFGERLNRVGEAITPMAEVSAAKIVFKIVFSKKKERRKVMILTTKSKHY